MLKKNRILALVLVLVLTLALAACGGPKNSPEDLAGKYAEAVEKMDVAAMVELAPEQQMQSEMEEDVTMEEAIQLLDAFVQEGLKELKEEYGEIKITCTVEGKGTLDASMKDYIVEDFKEYYELTVEEVAVYTLNLKVAAGEETEEDTMDCYLVMIDGEWYVDLDYSDGIYDFF